MFFLLISWQGKVPTLGLISLPYHFAAITRSYRPEWYWIFLSFPAFHVPCHGFLFRKWNCDWLNLGRDESIHNETVFGVTYCNICSSVDKFHEKWKRSEAKEMFCQPIRSLRQQKRCCIARGLTWNPDNISKAKREKSQLNSKLLFSEIWILLAVDD